MGKDIEKQEKPLETPADPNDPAECDPSDEACVRMAHGSAILNRFSQIPESGSIYSQKLEKYFEGHDDLRKYYEGFKAHLKGQFDRLRTVPPQGTNTSRFINQLADDYESNFDKNMLVLFEAIHVKDYPEVLGRILQNNNFPLIFFNTEEYNGMDMSEYARGYGQASYEGGIPFFVLSVDSFEGQNSSDKYKNTTPSYELFRHVFLHEFLHVFIDGFHSDESDSNLMNPIKTEGITNMLTLECTGFSVNTARYKIETNIARSLFLIDERAVLAWYVRAIDDAEFKRILQQKISPAVVDDLFIFFRPKFSAEAVKAGMQKIDLILKQYTFKSGEAGKKAVSAAIEAYLSAVTPDATAASAEFSKIIRAELDEVSVSNLLDDRSSFWRTVREMRSEENEKLASKLHTEAVKYSKKVGR